MPITLITGTSMGIGFATAVALGRAGHEVYATMRSPSRAPELQALVAMETLPISVLPLGVDDDASVREAAQHVLAVRGQIDVLVKNAGVSPWGAIEELSLSEFRRTMETKWLGLPPAWKEVHQQPWSLTE